MDQLRLSARRTEPLLTITVIGTLDMATTTDLVGFVCRSMKDTDQCLDLDLSGLAFIDASGLGALIGIRNHTRQHGAHLILTHTSSRFQHLLAITRLDGLFILA